MKMAASYFVDQKIIIAIPDISKEATKSHYGLKLEAMPGNNNGSRKRNTN